MRPVSEPDFGFDLYYNRKYLSRMRGGMVAAILLVALFGLLDVLTLPPEVYTQTLRVRVAPILPILLAVWAATYRAGLQAYLQPIIGVGAMVVAHGVVVILWIARKEGAVLPYEGIILVTIFVYFLLGLRLPAAALCGWSSCVTYIFMEWQAGLRGDPLLFSAMFLISTNIAGSVGAYFGDAGSLETFRAERALKALAERDFLTGLYNRRAMQDRAERAFAQAQREGRPIAVALMDVDHFKRYNDLYGHSAGDEVLVLVAGAIEASCRRPLDFMARYGGEEFVGVWFDLSAEDACARVEDIRQRVEALDLPHEGSTTAPRVTLSAGVCWCKPGEASFVQSLQMADQALYAAKAGGRNRVRLASEP